MAGRYRMENPCAAPDSTRKRRGRLATFDQGLAALHGDVAVLLSRD
jgi:hypothetical protein